MRIVRVAAAQYPLDRFKALDAYEAKIVDWIAGAAATGADLVVFPEYGALELAALAGGAAADMRGASESIGRLIGELDALHQMLARHHGVHVLASSAPERGGDGATRNVARLFAPSGRVGRQEKLVPSRPERDDWGVVAGSPLHVFRTSLGTVGIAIGFDVEFPMLVRAQVEAGAEIILAPAATSTAHGAWRVRHASAARAVENQCFVVRASLVGDAPWSSLMPRAIGTAGAHAPPDGPFPDDGVVALGEEGRRGWTHMVLDLDATAAVRADGSVLNHLQWREQGVVAGPLAEVVDLT